MNNLPPDHFLNLQRPDVFVPTLAGTPDTSTLAAHDFDVDTRTGFMPPQPPLSRLPEAWEPWEAALDDAISTRLQLAERPSLSEEDEKKSESWRNSIREVCGSESSEGDLSLTYPPRPETNRATAPDPPHC